MKILFVAFEFPPLGSGGVQRPMGFVQYLPEFGIAPVVLTPDAQSLTRIFYFMAEDSGLLSELRPDLIVERVPCASPSRWPWRRPAKWPGGRFSLVEPHARLWQDNLIASLPGIIRRHQPSLIFVTLPPFAMAPLWQRIACRLDLPLVLDFRDAWSHWCVGPYRTRLHYVLTLMLERKCLRAAARVICASDQIRADLLSAHPTISPNKVVTVTNGHEADCEDWSLDARRDPTSSSFVIGYAGNFYYLPEMRDAMMTPWWRKRPDRVFEYAPRREDWLYRSPYFFFRAVRRLFDGNPEFKTVLRVRFAGHKPDWIDGQVREFGLQDNVEFLGFLDHQRVLDFQASCDALLVTSSKVIGGRDYSIAGKTFEYFRCRKPIVGFVTEGAQRDELVRSEMAVTCEPDDPEASAVTLADLIRGRVVFRPCAPFLMRRHRRYLTRQLADVLHQVAGADRTHDDAKRGWGGQVA